MIDEYQAWRENMEAHGFVDLDITDYVDFLAQRDAELDADEMAVTEWTA